MKIKEKFYWINQIEQKGLEVFTFDQINWWPLIRCFLFRTSENEESSHSQAGKSDSYFHNPRLIPLRIKEYLEIVEIVKKNKNTIHKISQLTNRDYCLVGSVSNYKYQEDGLFNRYIDPLCISSVGTKVVVSTGEIHDGHYVVEPNLSLNFYDNKRKKQQRLKALLKSVFLLKHKPKYSKKFRREIERVTIYIKSFDYFQNYDLV
jgi:hypothetical protein